MDNWVDPIKDQVAWDFGYVNFEGFKKALREGNETAWIELDIITSKIAREYGKDVEKNYSDDAYEDGYEECEKEYEDKISDLEDEISYLEDDVKTLEEQLETCGERIIYLEELLDNNEINYAG